MHAVSRVKGDFLVHQQTPDCIYIRRAIGQALLNGGYNLCQGAQLTRRDGMRRLVQRQSARPDMGIAEPTVGIDLTGIKAGARTSKDGTRLPCIHGGVVIIRIKYELRLPPHG